jgi:DNA processing protein
VKLAPLDPTYPPRLCHLDEPPTLTVSGPLEHEGRRAIAIVGARDATDAAMGFVHNVAYHLAKAGMVIVSGGAVGVDATAHEAALKAGGTTWCVACCGRGCVFPGTNRDLFERIKTSRSSRMIWPFPDFTPKDKHTPRQRNRVLVGLAEAVIVVQAQIKSGSRNAIACARQLGRKLIISPSHPWDLAYAGSIVECLRGGVDVLWSIPGLFETLGLPPPDLEDPDAISGGIQAPKLQARPVRTRPQTYSERPLFPVDPGTWTENEKLVFSLLSMAPLQQDAIIGSSGLSTSSTLTALLTLSLKDVVVEGPDGFFRRRISL